MEIGHRSREHLSIPDFDAPSSSVKLAAKDEEQVTWEVFEEIIFACDTKWQQFASVRKQQNDRNSLEIWMVCGRQGGISQPILDSFNLDIVRNWLLKMKKFFCSSAWNRQYWRPS